MTAKRIWLTACALAFMTAFGAGAAHAQQQLGAAIQDSAVELSAAFERGYGVAVLAVHSDSAQMSDHIINEMIVAFMGMQHARGITVVNRMQLSAFVAQLGFDTAGEIDDATARSLGNQMGVRYVVTGVFESTAGFFRLSVQVVDVETGATLSAHTDVPIDSVVASLMGIAWSPPQEPRRIFQYPARFWSVGASFGGIFLNTRFYHYPVPIVTLQTTIAPWNNWFFRVGGDLGTALRRWDTGYTDLYTLWISPFVHFVFFQPFGARGGWYIGAGGSYSMGQYIDRWWDRDGDIVLRRTIVAVNLTTGINIGNWVDISYTLQTPFSARITHRLSAGVTWRFQQRSR